MWSRLRGARRRPVTGGRASAQFLGEGQHPAAAGDHVRALRVARAEHSGVHERGDSVALRGGLVAQECGNRHLGDAMYGVTSSRFSMRHRALGTPVALSGGANAGRIADGSFHHWLSGVLPPGHHAGLANLSVASAAFRTPPSPQPRPGRHKRTRMVCPARSPARGELGLGWHCTAPYLWSPVFTQQLIFCCNRT